MWQRFQVSADRGGIAAGRDIIGIPPAELPAIIEAATGDWKQLTEEQRQTITALKGALAVSEAALIAFFRTLGEANVPCEQLEARLIEIAESYNSVRAQVVAAPSDPPEIARLKTEASAALEAGDLEQAEDLLRRALAAEDAAIEERQVEAARTLAQLGGISLARLRYRDAAVHFAAAAKRAPADHERLRLPYLDQEAEALYRQGAEFGDNAALVDAINRLKALVELRPRARVPLDWAATQNNLGIALSTLGNRELGTSRLEEAITAHRAALEEWTRDREPRKWATAQNNLGTALSTLGERESGTRRLREAVTAFRSALKEWRRDREPLNWAAAQNNLGGALARLGERESGTRRLQEAVTAFRSALKEWKRDREPLVWATAQHNLGGVLVALGERQPGSTWLEEAVEVFRDALEVRTRDRVPLAWAATQHNLGLALSTLGDQQPGTARLEKAVAAFRAALEVTTSDRFPRDWIRTQGQLGIALLRLGVRQPGTTRLEEAVEVFRAALEKKACNGWHRAAAQTNLGGALFSLARRERDVQLLNEARVAVAAAYEIFNPYEQEQYRADFEIRLQMIDAAIGSLGEKTP